MTTRRGFIGGLLAGGVSLAAGVKLNNATEINKKLIVPERLADDLDGLDVEFATPEDLGSLGLYDIKSRTWFGAAERDLMKMSAGDYSRFLNAHLDVNRRFGVDICSVTNYKGGKIDVHG